MHQDETDQRVLSRAMKHLAPYVLPRWRMFAAALAALLAGAGFELLKPWPLKFVFDWLLTDRVALPAWFNPPAGDPRSWLVAAVCLAILTLAALSGLAAYFREYHLKRLGEEVAFDLRRAVFAHLQNLSLAFHDARRSGDVLSRISGDAASVRDLASYSMLEIATAVVTIVGMLGVMIAMDWHLAIIGLVTVPVLAPVVFHFRKRIEQAAKKLRKHEIEVSSVAQETMSSLRLVKAMGRERHQHQQFSLAGSKSFQAGLEAAKLEARYVWVVDIVGALGTCAVVWWGVHRVLAGRLSPGDLIVFVAYVRGLYAPMRDMAKQSIKISKGMIGLARVLEVLETAPAVTDLPHARTAPPLRGQIEFRDVSFAYRPDRPVLERVSFRIEPGQTVALVGYSGAGKSTILSLLPRLYDPAAGEIRIDGEDARNFRLESLRQQMSFVLQDSILLQTSILENILYGRSDASPDDVEAAAEAAGIAQFIDRLPDGFQTMVGPRGVMLSGGERQRVAIARAMVRGAPILLLDEPTTGLDVETERLVMDALERLMRGKTTIVISHKLNLIERADQVLVVDDGRVVESGSPAELRAAGGLFARLHELATHNYGVIEDQPRHAIA
jgi:ABC-type multidrug transport system fused ATPase/permease subunit